MKSICAVVLLVFTSFEYSNAIACQRLPPALDRLVRGIDITSLDLIPTEMTKSNGFNHPIMEFTCNAVRKWSNPSDPSILYDVPDQVETINNLPGGIVDFKSSLYNNNEDIKKTMSASLEIGYTPGLFGLSGSYAEGQTQILQNTNSLAEQSAYVSGFEVELKPYWELKLGETAQHYVDQFLPATYAAGPAKYEEFLSTFGTHFFGTGYYGGYLTNRVEISQALSDRMKENDIKVQAEATFLTSLHLKGGYNGAIAAISNDFRGNSHSHEAFYGGNANLLSGAAGTYGAWWTTVARNPWLFGGKILPITDLLAAGPKKDGIAQAIGIKLDRSYIEDLLRSLDLVNKLSLTNHAQANAFIAQVNALKAQPIPNHAQLLNLGVAINAYVISERNKTAQQCHKEKKDIFWTKTVCVTIHNGA